MEALHVLLLTDDGELQSMVAEAVLQIRGVSYCASDVDDALANACAGLSELDVAIIDFEHRPYGLTLLSALKACQEHLPVIAVVEHGDKHVEALAYSMGATACLCKPFSKYALVNAIQHMSGIKSSLLPA